MQTFIGSTIQQLTCQFVWHAVPGVPRALLPPTFFIFASQNELVLELLLSNQENLLFSSSVSDDLGCSDHNIVEFGILEVCTKTEDLDFRRTKYSSLRALLGGILWEGSLEACWGYSGTFSWKHKNIYAFKREGKQAKENALGLL